MSDEFDIAEDFDADKGWTDVPDECRDAWNTAFMTPHEDVYVTAPCPVCGQKSLIQYYQVGRPIEREGFKAHGAGWEFCLDCKTREHFSALVYEWWESDLVVGDHLTYEPDAIVEALVEREKQRKST